MSIKALSVLAGMAGGTGFAELTADDKRALLSYSGFFGAWTADSAHAVSAAGGAGTVEVLEGLYRRRTQGWEIGPDIHMICGRAPSGSAVLLGGVTCPAHLALLGDDLLSSGNLVVHTPDPVTAKIIRLAMPKVRLAEDSLADLPRRSFDAVYLSTNIYSNRPPSFFLPPNAQIPDAKNTQHALLACSRLTAPGGAFGLTCYTGSLFYRERGQSEIVASRLARFAVPVGVWLPTDASGFARIVMRKSVGPIANGRPLDLSSLRALAQSGIPGLFREADTPLADFRARLAAADFFAGHTAPRSVVSAIRWNSYHTDGRDVWYNHHGTISRVVTASATEARALVDAVTVVAAAREFLETRSSGRGDAEAFEEARTRLLAAYTSFHRRHGRLRQHPVLERFLETADYPFLLCLETSDGSDGWRPSSVFDLGIGGDTRDLATGLSPQEALSECRRRSGRLDLAMLSDLTGMSQDMVLTHLENQVLYLPQNDTWVFADEHLCGDIITKKEAISAGRALLEKNLETTPADSPQAVELSKKLVWARAAEEMATKAAPHQADADDVVFRLGERWQPQDVVISFVRSVLGSRLGSIVCENGRWRLTSNPGTTAVDPVATPHYSGVEIMRTLLVFGRFTSQNTTDALDDDDDNPDAPSDDVAGETLARLNLANARIDELHHRFNMWVRENPARLAKLLALYNEAKNRFVLPKADRSVLSLEGLNPAFKPTDMQLDFAAICTRMPPQVLYAYPGSGKTFVMATAIRERMRTGLNSKALVVTLPNLVGELVREFEKTYPGMGADVRVISYQQATRHPGQVVADILAADRGIWVMGYNSFSAMPLGGAPEGTATMNAVEDLEARMEIAADTEMAALVRVRDDLLASHRAAMDSARGQSPVSIVDALAGGMIVCDEADALRNLRGKGPGNLGLSGNALTDKACAIFDQMRERYPNFALIMASGTLAEGRSFATIWPYLRYCMPQTLAAAGETELVDWLRGNTVITESVVPTPDKGLVTKQVIMPNGSPMLTAMLESLIRYHPQSVDAVGLPKLTGGDIELRPLPINRFQWSLLRAFAEKNDPYENLAEFLPQRPHALAAPGKAVHAGDAGVTPQNGAERLRLWGQMVRACVEPRFVGNIPTQSGSKITRAVLDVVEDKIRNMGRPSVTLIFVDQVSSTATGFGIADGNGWRREFEAAGILPERVAFAHEHTGRRRGQFLERIRRGEFDAVISTRRGLGIGANIQDYVSQIIYLDVPLTTAPHNQSLCRGIRRGNHYQSVQVHFYVISRSGELCLANHLKNKSEGQNALWRRSGFKVGDAAAAVEMLAGSMVSEIFGRDDDRLGRLETLKRIEIPRTEALARLEASRRQRLALGITGLEREIAETRSFLDKRRAAGHSPEDLEIGASILMDGKEMCARTALAERFHSANWNQTGRPLKDVVLEHAAAIRAMEPDAAKERLELIRAAIRGKLTLDAYPGMEQAELRLVGMIGGSQRQDLDALYQEGCSSILEITPLGIEAALTHVLEKANHLPRNVAEMHVASMGKLQIFAKRPNLGGIFDVDLHVRLDDWNVISPISCFGRSGSSVYHSMRSRLDEARKAFADMENRLGRMEDALRQAREELALPAGEHENTLARLNGERAAIIADLQRNPPQRDDRDPSVPIESSDQEAFGVLGAAWTRYRSAAATFASQHGLDFDGSPRSVDEVAHCGLRDFSDQAPIDVASPSPIPSTAIVRPPAEAPPPLDTDLSEVIFRSISDLGDAFARERGCLLEPAPGNWIADAHAILERLVDACNPEEGSGSPIALRYLSERAERSNDIFGYLGAVAYAAGWTNKVSVETSPGIFRALGEALAKEGSAGDLPEPIRAASSSAAKELLALNQDMAGVRLLVARVRQDYDEALMKVANHIYDKSLHDGHFQMLTSLMQRHKHIMDPVAGPLIQTALGLGGIPILDVMDGKPTRSDAENEFYRTMLFQVASGSRGPRFLQGRFAHHNYATLSNDVFGQTVRGRGSSEYGKLMFITLLGRLFEIWEDPRMWQTIRFASSQRDRPIDTSVSWAAKEVWGLAIFNRRTESRHAARIVTRQDLMMCLLDTPAQVLVAAAVVSNGVRRPRKLMNIVNKLVGTGMDGNAILDAALTHRALEPTLEALIDPGLIAAATQMGIASSVLSSIRRSHPSLYGIAGTYRASLAARGFAPQLTLLGQMLERVADGSFLEWRYTNEIARRQLAGLSPKAVEEWRTNSVYKLPDGGWVVESDDPALAMRAGSPVGDIPASCQRANGGAYNQCMLAYVLDANKKIFYAFDRNGRPNGRMIAKIAGSPPHLIDQGVYGPATDALHAALSTKAKSMDLVPCCGKRTGFHGMSRRTLEIVNVSVNGFEYDDNIGIGEMSGPASIDVSPLPYKLLPSTPLSDHLSLPVASPVISSLQQFFERTR